MNAEQKDFRSNLKPLAAKSPSPEKESTPPKEASPPRQKTPPKSPTPEKEPTPPPAPKEPTPEPVKEKESEPRKSSQIAPRKRKPKITSFPDDIIECTVDAPFEISLEVENAERVIWLIGDEEVMNEPDDGVHLSFNAGVATLRVDSSLDDDSGLYTIICENEQGEARAQVTVVVKGN